MDHGGALDLRDRAFGAIGVKNEISVGIGGQLKGHLWIDALACFEVVDNGLAVDEHYWASYIASADIACTTIEVFYDVAIEENWNKWEAAEGIELWAETMNEAVQAQPGLRAISDDEATSITAAGINASGCAWIWEFFDEFIES